jgi:hypothetical protein
MRRPIVTLTVQPNDASFFSHQLICHIDTGADPGLVLRSYQKAIELGLSVNDRSAFFGDPEAEFEIADGTVVQYLIDFLYIAEWVDGKPRWVKVLVPPRPIPADQGAGPNPTVEAAQYHRPDALLGLDLLRSTEFRLNDIRKIVQLLPT